MAYEKRIATLIVLLAVVFAALGFVYTGEFEANKSKDNQIVSNSSDVYIELTHNVTKSGVREVVSDRFQSTKTDDGYIIVASSDGSKYVVKSGTVLVDDKIIKVTDEESSVLVLENRD